MSKNARARATKAAPIVRSRPKAIKRKHVVQAEPREPAMNNNSAPIAEPVESPPHRNKISIAVAPDILAWASTQAALQGRSLSSVFTSGIEELRRKGALQALLVYLGETEPQSPAMFSFMRAEAEGTDTDVTRIGAAWGSIDKEQYDDAAHAIVRRYAQARFEGQSSRALVEETLRRLVEMAR
jgi:hypothetical protein